MTLEEAEIVAAPESVLAVSLPGSVLLGVGASVGDVMIQEYTPEVAQTVGKLIESVDVVSRITIPTLFESFNLVTSGLVDSFSQAIGKQSDTSMATTELLGEKLLETELGQAAILPGIAKYLVIAVIAIIVAGKVWKK